MPTKDSEPNHILDGSTDVSLFPAGAPIGGAAWVLIEVSKEGK